MPIIIKIWQYRTIFDLLRDCSTSHQQCRRPTMLPNSKRTLNSEENDQKLQLLNCILFGTVVPTLNSAEVQHC